MNKIDKNKVNNIINGLLFNRLELVDHNINIYELRKINRYFQIYSVYYEIATDEFIESNLQNEKVSDTLVSLYFNDVKKDINFMLSNTTNMN